MGKVLNKRSSALVDGKAKLPTASQIDYGEIAINFAKGKETISIKNSEDEIVTFSSDKHIENIIEENEYVVSQAINDINDRIPETTSDLTNDSGFITGYTETDPTVPSWAKQSTKPTYTASEVGALSTGATLDNVPDGTNRKLSNYATSSDMNDAIEEVSGNIITYIDNKVSSVYTYKGSVANYSDLASITTKEAGDVYNVVNENGTTPAGTNYAWTGSNWDALGGSIDLSNYVETSAFTAHTGNSAIHLTTGAVETQITSHNYITGYTETDPTVPSWAKQSTKPTYTASEVGALPTGTTLDNVPDGTTRKLSNYATQANFTAHTGNSSIHITTGDVKSQIEAYNYITGYTETDPTVPSWAKQSTKPSYTASEVGAMATSERSNYLPTGTTLDDVTDGTTRKLSNYATQANFTAHTANTEIHVTTAQTSAWDSKVSNVQSDWNATTGLAAILNKPAIPTVNDNTITLTFNGATVGTFTLNQNSNKTIDIGTIIGLPSFSSANNGQILGVVNGALAWITPTTIYTGSGTPSSSQGNDGDIYLQTS